MKPNAGTKATCRFACDGVLALFAVPAFFDVALVGVPLDAIDMKRTGFEPVFQTLGGQRWVELVHIESLGEGYLLVICGTSQGVHRVPVGVVRRREGSARLVVDVFSGPVGAVAASEGFTEQMGWALSVESVKEADIINDESIVLRDDAGDNSPARLIGNEPGKLHVGELDGYCEGAVLLWLFMGCERRQW
jgi:hypothetical protein